MNPLRKRRLITLGLMLLGVSVAAGLVLYALRSNINLYFTPSQVIVADMQNVSQFRMGGMVEKGSVRHDKTGLGVHFQLTDYTKVIWVHYNGILPALFREGQGLVVQGHLNAEGEFVANQVLAKHDEKYRPPSIKNPTEIPRVKSEQKLSYSIRTVVCFARYAELDPGSRPGIKNGSLRGYAELDPGSRSGKHREIWNRIPSLTVVRGIFL